MPSDISFLFVTMNRPQAARRLIDSVRQMYPEMPIYVGDQSEPGPAMRTFYEERRVVARFFPFDSGVSYCRSELVKEIGTDFVLYGDDDFVFTEKSSFDVPRRILEQNGHIGLVGGSVIDIFISSQGQKYRSFRRWEKKVYLDEESQLFLSVPIDHLPPEIGCVDGQQYYFCDMTLNWALCRRDMFIDQRVLWDPQFKSNGEHENFFLQLKKHSPYRVVYYPGMQCDHHHIGDSTYERLRSREDGWVRFGRKWNVVAHLEIGVGLRYYADYERVTRYGSLACPRSGPGQSPLQQTGYIRVWPEGYVEAGETSCDFHIQKLESELRAIYGSRCWRAALLMRNVANKLRKLPGVRYVGRNVLAAIRRMRGGLGENASGLRIGTLQGDRALPLAERLLIR